MASLTGAAPQTAILDLLEALRLREPMGRDPASHEVIRMVSVVSPGQRITGNDLRRGGVVQDACCTVVNERSIPSAASGLRVLAYVAGKRPTTSSAAGRTLGESFRG